ncbi:nitroreductase family protein [Accumulibacter sp.]|jgi:nitroreductase|uniref:Nitroreductase domain-containing protein n=1 Tax=Accumulibacter regalis TaxID=522306 RepID=C7RU34_ACCRE|nr:nitroreductase family protein [Accumulibacter sp.]MBN8496144.1 nitroreductase family protein [Accumulibacter sp.]MBO3716170.1 nitroreductase family protein [Accumulibacter sp.]
MNRETLLQLLDLARWAPSGDNTQPWRFSIVGDQHLRVHGHDTRDHVLYDYEGRASHMAHGALLETLRVAASGFGLATHWTVEADEEARAPTYDVHFSTNPGVPPDPLFPHIQQRVVQRRPMRTTPLTAAQRAAIEAAAGDEVAVQYFASFAKRLKVASLLWHNAEIRLTCPEAFAVHRDVIEWRARFSQDRIPEQAVGVDPMTARLMEWVMQSWERVQFFNRYLLGTVIPRVELDFLPAVLCGAHLLLRPRQAPAGLHDWVRLGMCLQRVWLTVAREGLHLQPELTPVIFRWYARADRRFSADPALFASAHRLAQVFEDLAGCGPDEPFFFFCRVGVSSVPSSRSLRLERERLMR